MGLWRNQFVRRKVKCLTHKFFAKIGNLKLETGRKNFIALALFGHEQFWFSFCIQFLIIAILLVLGNILGNETVILRRRFKTPVYAQFDTFQCFPRP